MLTHPFPLSFKVHFYEGAGVYPLLNGANTTAPGQYSPGYVYPQQSLGGGTWLIRGGAGSLIAGEWFIVSAISLAVCVIVALVLLTQALLSHPILLNAVARGSLYQGKHQQWPSSTHL